MNLESQPTGGYQLDLFKDWSNSSCLGAGGDGGSESAAFLSDKDLRRRTGIEPWQPI